MAVAELLRGTFVRGRTETTRRRRSQPVLGWLFTYRRKDLVGDLLAGAVVAIMLVPQAMAYALLAGLPAEAGLYASILPLILYGILGTSPLLSVGPVAIVSLLVVSTISPLAESGSPVYLQMALTLALMSGLLQLAMGLLRMGSVVNLLSHPVLFGFTNAAAIIIGASQIKHLLGISVPRTAQTYELLFHLLGHITESRPMTLTIGLTSVAVLLYFRSGLGAQLRRWGVPEWLIIPIVKAAPLVSVVLGTLVVSAARLHDTAGVNIVGEVPGGIPALTLPVLNTSTWGALLPGALTISFVGFMQSIAMARALASKRRQTVGVNQELVALGMANLGAAFTGGYPVTGGFSRSAVNLSAGANTPLASLLTAALIGLAVLFLTPLFYFVPQAVLASIILVAVLGLIDFSDLKRTWHYNKPDAVSMAVTFLAVLSLGVQTGILLGVGTAIGLLLWRTSHPYVAILGRLGDGESFLDVEHNAVMTCPHVVAVRVDESLFFANASFVQDRLLQIVAERPEVQHLVLDGTAINFIDASALDTLEALVHDMRGAGVTLHLTSVKGPVLDRLQAVGFLDKLGADHVFLSTHDAFMALRCN